MKKIAILAILLTVSLISLSQQQPQQKQPDSITVYQFMVHPQSFKTATQLMSDKFLKNGTVSDTVLMNNVFQLLFSNGKQVKVVNPEAVKSKVEVPIKSSKK